MYTRNWYGGKYQTISDFPFYENTIKANQSKNIVCSSSVIFLSILKGIYIRSYRYHRCTIHMNVAYVDLSEYFKTTEPEKISHEGEHGNISPATIHISVYRNSHCSSFYSVRIFCIRICMFFYICRSYCFGSPFSKEYLILDSIVQSK